ncbi:MULTISPECIES: hypothetical protein [Halomonas]|uniref:hypothetical protein n=1 Tax=Halomonas TaxID=2745 RepID=UPI001C94F6BE|nr:MULTISPECIES: hypothetical protein [Halomonas]MBY6208774.1 hypothetical protein [Halomonas sp. DP3Y7-2]MBY6227244.1 hypothetical protein [Halomonas sp. DP3Y7-1]MCA0915006.1 hypothetical protein [Halomonas denitrificans]
MKLRSARSSKLATAPVVTPPSGPRAPSSLSPVRRESVRVWVAISARELGVLGAAVVLVEGAAVWLGAGWATDGLLTVTVRVSFPRPVLVCPLP